MQSAIEEAKNVQEQQWLKKHDQDMETDVMDKIPEDDGEVEDEENLRLKLEDRARQRRKEERDGIQRAADAKMKKVDSLFSSQKQRNIGEGRKAQIRRDEGVVHQMDKEKIRVAKEQNAMRKRIQEENERIRKIQETQRLEMERRRNNVHYEEEQLQKVVSKYAKTEVGTCLTVGFLPFF